MGMQRRVAGGDKDSRVLGNCRKMKGAATKKGTGKEGTVEGRIVEVGITGN